ncbi:MAG: hypothetical protein ACFFDN_05215 [Candidatus Hodarchaeota archaeon]
MIDLLKFKDNINITDYYKPVNQKLICAFVSCNLDVKYSKTKKWELSGFFERAIIEEIEDKDKLKEIRVNNAINDLKDRIENIIKTKEIFVPKYSEELLDETEEHIFEIVLNKAHNEKYRNLSYKENENGFYVKVDDINYHKTVTK